MPNALSRPVYILGIGGTLRPASTTEKAVRLCLRGAEEAGARTLMIGGPELDLPMYAPERPERGPAALRLVEEMRRADGIVIGSPGYHGGVSGLVKNALDYTEDMRADPAPYFHGRPVGVLATGAGWQGAVSTLSALRSIVHALRGWNTPMGVPINTMERLFDDEDACLDPRIADMLLMMGREVAEGAQMRAQARAA